MACRENRLSRPRPTVLDTPLCGDGAGSHSSAGTVLCLGTAITPLEPQNTSLYYIQVKMSPKRVSSCKCVNEGPVGWFVGDGEGQLIRRGSIFGRHGGGKKTNRGLAVEKALAPLAMTESCCLVVTAGVAPISLLGWQ